MKQYTKYLSWILLLAVALVCIGFLMHGHEEENQAMNTANVQQNEQKQWQIKDANNQNNVSNKFAKYMKYSHDPIVKSIHMNANNNTIIQKPVQQFFTVFYNWNNGKDYTSRTNKLRNIASPQLLSNKKIFDNGLDKSGDSYIDMLQVHSQYNNVDMQTVSVKGNILTVEANVTYNSWSSGESKKTGETFYELTFDKLSHEITSLKKIYNIQNVQYSNHQ